MSSLSDLIREERERLEMTQEQLAERLGIHPTGITRRESGKVVPSYAERRKLSAIFGYSFDEFEAKWRASAIARPMSNPGIPVINRGPAGTVRDMDEWGVDSTDGFEFIDRDHDTQAEHVKALVVTGDSMEPTLHEGDYLVLHPLGRERPIPGQPELEDGAVVRVQISADAKQPGCTVARYFNDGDQVKLVKDNRTYPPLIIKREQIEQISVAIQVRSKRGLRRAKG